MVKQFNLNVSQYTAAHLIGMFPKPTKTMKFEDALRCVGQSLKDPSPITASCSVFISKLRETGRYSTVFKQHGVHLSCLMALNSNFG